MKRSVSVRSKGFQHGSRLILALFAFFLLLEAPAFAQWQSIGNLKSYKREANRIALDCQSAQIQITALAPDLVRVRMVPGQVFGPDESWAVVKTDWPATSLEVLEHRTSIRAITPELVIEISKSPCRVTLRDRVGNVINQDDPEKGMSWDGKEVRVWKTLPPDEFYYGLGEKAGPLEHRGQSFVNWNTDAYGYRWGTDPIYQSIPFLLALRRGKSYGIFFDNTYRSIFDLGKMHRDQYFFGAQDGELNYYFFYGPHPKKVIERYAELIGRMPLPPRWALGYQQCRYSYEPESRVRTLVENFRRRHIPCDVIYLDIDYMEGYRIFTVSQEKFPDLQRMISDFSKVGMKVVTIIDPGIKQEPGYWVYDEGLKGDHFVKRADGSNFTGNVWPGLCVFPDFTREFTRQWWGSLYKGLVDAGVKGFWNDMNEPAVFVEKEDQVDRTLPPEVVFDDHGHKTNHLKSHNVFGMQMARGTFEGVQKLRPNERPFVLTRASYAGGQRYAAAWTGDNSSTWDHLQLWIPITLNFGLSGQPFAGPDIGGFSGNPTPELYTRFLQAGALSPLSRTHADKGSKDREPWSYGPEYETINRRSIELRYRLMPYLYTVFEEASRTGIPVMRPLFLEYPEEAKTYRLDTEFLLGSDLLVAPVMTEGATSRNVYLPSGDWFNFWTSEKVVGPKEIQVAAPIDVLPLFARGGAIIPMQQVVQYTDEASINPLTLNIFPGQNASAMLYEDDGLSYQYQKGRLARTAYRFKQTPQEILIEIGQREGGYVPASRSYQLQFNGMEKSPSRVQLGSQDLPRAANFAELQQQTNGWTFDSLRKIVWVKFPDKGSAETVAMTR